MKANWKRWPKFLYLENQLIVGRLMWISNINFQEKNNDTELAEEGDAQFSDCKDDDFETDEEEEIVGEQIEEESRIILN